ncbi:MAG: MBL fold metallo-hydrolase [Candidatus Woesearchaeota archaeon]|nr:MAG: MBL fold metallo-hydrolase [Candidatus Woesearchaeota archaeon]
MGELVFHGAANEVGRSCIELRSKNRYLFDYGIKFSSSGYDYPEGLKDPEQVSALFLSHAHLDHSGGLPLLVHELSAKKVKFPFYMTPQTWGLIKILLKDSYKIARIKHLHPAYDSLDLRKISLYVKPVRLGTQYEHRGDAFSFYNAGHIPGAGMLLLQTEGKNILYTGDFNPGKQLLMAPADAHLPPIDIMITESTYGNRPLPEKAQLAEEFLSEVERVVKNGGRVVIPVFAVGRAQDILIILSRAKWDVPVYFDGMATKITKTVLRNSERHLQGRPALKEMFSKVRFVSSEKRRNYAATRPGIFVSTSGMVQGGPVIHYIKHIWHDPKSAIFLTGYQCHRCQGRMLLEERAIYLKGWKTQVDCDVKQFMFSGHADQNHLHAFIESINPKKLIVQHGDPEAIEAMLAWGKKALPQTTVMGPSIGETITF